MPYLCPTYTTCPTISTMPYLPILTRTNTVGSEEAPQAKKYTSTIVELIPERLKSSTDGCKLSKCSSAEDFNQIRVTCTPKNTMPYLGLCPTTFWLPNICPTTHGRARRAVPDSHTDIRNIIFHICTFFSSKTFFSWKKRFNLRIWVGSRAGSRFISIV